MTTKPQTADAINRRMSEAGAELAKLGWIASPESRALERELEALKVEYLRALEREGEEKLIATIVETRRQQREHDARKDRVAKAVEARLAAVHT
jgi:hypothetical protein